MQFDIQRAFPYPVLRPNIDDYIDGDIQATVTFDYSEDSAELTAEISFALSVPEIKDEIAAGRAEYICVFACRDTYYRRAVGSDKTLFSVKFPAGALRGEVIISPYIIAVQPIASFSSKWINAEFGPGPFSFELGAPLAVDEPQAVYIDRDAFKPISSCFVLVKKDSLPDNEWRIEASQDKVHIAVSPNLKAKIDLARNNKKNQALLLNSIYFSAVMQCVSYLKTSDDYLDYKWANVFRQRLVDTKVEIKNHDESWVAQTLMKHPFSLIDTYFFGDTSE
ncbi:hypothetical protein [Methylobacterium sp. WL116]|uniref:hypothetical protein n=1 Tax=Methylobacterium sp. WL116 TaxID=2603889 RepID=UPI0011C71D20|nr:hypothetical protein [Methylobacterium sp. WL116]TXM94950.1 hypothetical protein FV223_02755 [Methylobacterium sp. WL116]